MSAPAIVVVPAPVIITHGGGDFSGPMPLALCIWSIALIVSWAAFITFMIIDMARGFRSVRAVAISGITAGAVTVGMMIYGVLALAQVVPA